MRIILSVDQLVYKNTIHQGILFSRALKADSVSRGWTLSRHGISLNQSESEKILWWAIIAYITSKNSQMPAAGVKQVIAPLIETWV